VRGLPIFKSNFLENEIKMDTYRVLTLQAIAIKNYLRSKRSRYNRHFCVYDIIKSNRFNRACRSMNISPHLIWALENDVLEEQGKEGPDGWKAQAIKEGSFYHAN
jgi:hypothetical protein